MSTRSYIAKKNSDNTYTYSYCHFDGYVDGVGETLNSTYNTDEKIEELLSYGDMSILGERIHPTDPEHHSFGHEKNEEGKYVPRYEDGVCLFYHRDRGEDDCFHEPITDLTELTYDGGVSFVYVWDSGKWYVWGDEYEGEELTVALNKEAVKSSTDD